MRIGNNINIILVELIRQGLRTGHSFAILDPDEGMFETIEPQTLETIHNECNSMDEHWIEITDTEGNTGGAVMFIPNNGSTLGEDICDYTTDCPYIDELTKKYGDIDRESFVLGIEFLDTISVANEGYDLEGEPYPFIHKMGAD